MSETFRCDDKQMLVAYLYDELEPDGRREVERHLRSCGACAREVDALVSVRRDLQTWVPPDRDLAIRLPGDGTRLMPLPASSGWAALHALPVWAQVAAAALFVGVGVSVANIQVRSTSAGVVVTTGWLPATVAAPAAAGVSPAASSASPAANLDTWRRELAAVEASLRQEIARQQAAIKEAVARRDEGPDRDTAAVLERVRAMIEASEERQRQELALRLTLAEQSWQQWELAHQAAIRQRMSSLQGRTMAVEASQQEMFNRLRRVALTPNQ
jgi:anti-sigma factor RsiW